MTSGLCLNPNFNVLSFIGQSFSLNMVTRVVNSWLAYYVPCLRACQLPFSYTRRDSPFSPPRKLQLNFVCIITNFIIANKKLIPRKTSPLGRTVSPRITIEHLLKNVSHIFWQCIIPSGINLPSIRNSCKHISQSSQNQVKITSTVQITYLLYITA